MDKERLQAAEYVLKDKPFRTLEDIREGIAGTLTSMEHSTTTLKRKSGSTSKGIYDGLEDPLVDDKNNVTSLLDSRNEPVNRTQTRLLMKTRGFPIKYFANLRELVLATYNAVEGPSFRSARLIISVLNIFHRS